MHKHPNPRQITSVKYPKVGKYFRAMHEKELQRWKDKLAATQKLVFVHGTSLSVSPLSPGDEASRW